MIFFPHMDIDNNYLHLLLSQSIIGICVTIFIVLVEL